MKVLHLHAGTLFGGVETVLTTFARERACCPEMEPSYGVCFEFRLSEELRAAGVPVTNLGAARISRPWTVWQARQAFARHLREARPDAVLCHMAKPLYLFGSVAKKQGVPVVYYIHNPVDPDATDVFDKLIRRIPKPDLVIGVSEHTAQSVRDDLYPDVPAVAVYNPLPFPAERFAITAEERAALRRELDTPDDAVVIIQATRLDGWKGHHDLLRALGAMRETPGWVHWLVGGAQREPDHAYLQSLKDLAVEQGIADRVRFAGLRSDVPRCMAASDVYCQANTSPEGLGMSFIEAMTAGIPVVTTDLGPAREVVGDDGGILTPPNDPAALAEVLSALVTNPERRAGLGRTARARVDRQFSACGQVRKLHDVLQEQGVARNGRTPGNP